MERVAPKYRHVLSRILNYLEVNKVHFSERLESLGNEDDKHALVAPVEQLQSIDIKDLFKVSDLVIADGLYCSRRSRKAWKMLLSRPEVTVSVDLFYFGLLFRRQGQTKEHFKLRFPFWLERV